MCRFLKRCSLLADNVAEVFLGWRTNIFSAVDAFCARRREGPHRFIQNRSRISVVALKSDTASLATPAQRCHLRRAAPSAWWNDHETPSPRPAHRLIPSQFIQAPSPDGLRDSRRRRDGGLARKDLVQQQPMRFLVAIRAAIADNQQSVVRVGGMA